jgi:predicted  nucleic acid-binding Zn-ribbon protein
MREKQTLKELQAEVVALEERSRTILGRLRSLAGQRSTYLKALKEAGNEDEARFWAQRLVALDQEEKALRSEWDRVEADLTNLRQALLTAQVAISPQERRRREELLKRVQEVLEERTRAEGEAQAAEKRAYGAFQVAERSLQEWREEAAQAGGQMTRPYLQLWAQARREKAPIPHPEEPPHSA